MNEDALAFHRNFQRAATDVARLYSLAYTAMEIEMGSATAPLLAPYILQSIVASAQEVAMEEAQTRARLEIARQIQKEEEAAAARLAERRQLTIDDALDARQGRPW